MVQGLPHTEEKQHVCEGCAFGKQHRLPFPKGVSWRAKEKLELVHTDVCGPMDTLSHAQKRMKRMVSKKSHSWWWDSHISRKNSKWLEENLQKMDGSVKQMLKLIEEEGESFAKKAEMYYQRRPELIAFVEDFYRMYRALAERYDQVTGDLRKNIESDLKSQGSDMSMKGSEGSDSSSSEPDSESEFDAIEVSSDRASLKLRHRVHELETQLSELKEKHEAKEKSDHDAAEMEIVNLKQKLEEANKNLEMKETELGLAEKKTAELEEQVEFLKGAAAAATAAAEKFQTDLSNDALAIEEYENELANEKEKFLKEKSTLEEQILNLENANMDRVKHISELDEGIVSLKATVEMLTADKDALAATVSSLSGELKCRHDRVIEMEQQVHQLQMEYANLNKEKEELNEEVDRQKIVISDVAERKREAIRQLCFSIEHYRDNYCRLLGLLQNHKRSAIVAN